MEMHQIQYFLAICEERHFTRAAMRCGVAQPTLSLAIQRLERECGGPLFIRYRSSGIRLTPLGAALQPHLEQIDRSARVALALARAADAHRPAIAVSRPHVSNRETLPPPDPGRADAAGAV